MKKMKWYSLPPLLTLFIVAAAALLQSAVFKGATGDFLRYFSYLFSTYALIVGVSGLVRFIRRADQNAKNSRLMQKLHTNDYAAKYLDDALYRTQINLYFGTAVNVAYILIKFFSGLVMQSKWLITFAVYYAALTVLRAALVHYVRRNDWKRDMRAEYRRYRLVGILLIGFNLVLSAIVSRMIGYDEAYDYPGILIYAMSAYTFYAVILAGVGLVRFRRTGSPVISAIKVVNLVAAMMAMLSLEGAMLRRFGSEGDSLFRHTMLGISGLVICLILLGISIYMIGHATGRLKRMESEECEFSGTEATK